MKMFLKVFFVFVLFLMSSQMFAQSGLTTSVFKVSGVCGMCKMRIEGALEIKGVKSASWNVKTQELTVSYLPNKVTEMQLHQNVAAVGHDTEKVKAKEENYLKVHSCCRYREMSTHD